MKGHYIMRLPIDPASRSYIAFLAPVMINDKEEYNYGFNFVDPAPRRDRYPT